MRAVPKASTKPEMRLRRELHARGLRYRVNVRGLPGTPDLVFGRNRIAVFVHGCFWHRHDGCRSATTPRVNSAYWGPKLRRNVERDAENAAALAALGYGTVVVWECEVARDPSAGADRVVAALPG
jgi:DNA mismatch endonuclease, patch repair protein